MIQDYDCEVPGVEEQPADVLFTQPRLVRAKRAWHELLGHPSDQRIGLRGSHWSGHVWLCGCGLSYMVKIS